jgi:hypothetical protein
MVSLLISALCFADKFVVEADDTELKPTIEMVIRDTATALVLIILIRLNNCFARLELVSNCQRLQRVTRDTFIAAAHDARHAEEIDSPPDLTDTNKPSRPERELNPNLLQVQIMKADEEPGDVRQ